MIIASMQRIPKTENVSVRLRVTLLVLPYMAVAVDTIKHNVLKGPRIQKNHTLIRP